MAQSPVVALCLWVKAGSCDEDPDQLGAAHFVEHMLFKGTRSRGVGQVALEVEALGGDINAFTTYDHTAYFATVPRSGWRGALEVLADMTQRSLFDPAELELEREVILEEIRGGGDDPLRALGEAVAAQAFAPHPYARPVIGTRRSVRRMSREALLRFWRRWYSTGNMILSVSGPVSQEEVEGAAQELFQPGAAPEASKRLPIAHQVRRRTAFVEDRFDEPAVEFAYRGVALGHPDAAAADVLAGMLGGSPASVLGARLQHGQEVAVDTWAVCECERDAGMVIVGLSPLRGKVGQATEAAAQLLAEVRAGHHLDLAGLECAKAQILASRLFGEESVESRAMDRAWYDAFTGDAMGGPAYSARVDAVTLAEVRRVARELLDPRKQVLGALLPRGEDAPAVLRERSRAVRAPAPAKPPEILRRVLPDGMTVVIESLEHSKIAAVRLVGLGGGLTEGPSSSGRAELWSQVIGAPGLSPQELAETLDRRGGSLSGVAGDNSIGLRCEFPARYLDEALELVGSMVVEPTFDGDELERVRATLIENEELSIDDPALLAWRLASATLFGAHPYGRSSTGSLRSLRALTAGSLRRMHERDLRASNLVLCVSGGVDPERTLKRIQRCFGERRSGPWRLPARPPAAFPRGGSTHELLHDREQAHVMLAMPGARYVSGDADALTLASTILGGQSGRLFLELRDRRGLAYQVGAESVDGWDPGRFVLSMSTEMGRAQQALDGLREVTAELADEGPSAAEMERAMATAVGTLDMARQRSSARAMELAYSDRYGRSATDCRQRTVQCLQRVTARQVRDALRRRLKHAVGVLAVNE